MSYKLIDSLHLSADLATACAWTWGNDPIGAEESLLILFRIWKASWLAAKKTSHITPNVITSQRYAHRRYSITIYSNVLIAYTLLCSFRLLLTALCFAMHFLKDHLPRLSPPPHSPRHLLEHYLFAQPALSRKKAIIGCLFHSIGCKTTDSLATTAS